MLAVCAFSRSIVKVEIELTSHDCPMMRLRIIGTVRAQPIRDEASMMKIRGSEIQQDLAEIVMENCRPVWAAIVAAALDGLPGTTAAGTNLKQKKSRRADPNISTRKVSIYGWQE